MENRNRGRPKEENTKTEVIRARVTIEEKERIRKKAEDLKMSISELILYAIRKLK